MYLAFFLISLAASVIGAICGIGGGVIIKPVLDLIGLTDAAATSFLSGCTVLAMCGYSVIRNAAGRESKIDYAVATPLAIGAAVGGAAGKQLFLMLRAASGAPALAGRMQAVILGVLTVGTLLYTVKKAAIRTRRTESRAASLFIGLSLGVLSSFLGIGGGPFNLVVLFYFYSMDTKTAAQNSLYVILLSQLTGLLTTVLTGAVPAFSPVELALMIAGGIGGGVLGRLVNKRIDDRTVDKLFLGLMCLIICICIYNTVR